MTREKVTAWLRVGVPASVRDAAEGLISQRRLSQVVTDILRQVLGDQDADELRAMIAEHKVDDVRRAHRLQVLEAQLRHVEAIKSNQATLDQYAVKLRTELKARDPRTREAFLTGVTGRRYVQILGPRAREIIREFNEKGGSER